MKKKNKAPVYQKPVVEEPKVETAEVVADEKVIANCPKCGAALYVKSGNFAHLCPVCSNVFRIRIREEMVKDVTRKTMVEAFVTIDKNDKGEVKTDSIVNEIK